MFSKSHFNSWSRLKSSPSLVSCIDSVTFSHSMLWPENDSSWAYQGVGWCVVCDDVKGITMWEFELNAKDWKQCWACIGMEELLQRCEHSCASLALCLRTELGHLCFTVLFCPDPWLVWIAFSKLVCHISTFSHYLCSRFRLCLLIIFLF